MVAPTVVRFSSTLGRIRRCMSTRVFLSVAASSYICAGGWFGTSVASNSSALPGLVSYSAAHGYPTAAGQEASEKGRQSTGNLASASLFEPSRLLGLQPHQAEDDVAMWRLRCAERPFSGQMSCLPKTLEQGLAPESRTQAQSTSRSQQEPPQERWPRRPQTTERGHQFAHEGERQGPVAHVSIQSAVDI